MIRDEIHMVERKLLGQDEQVTSAIRFGCLPSMACNIVPAAIAEWRKAHADVTLRVVNDVQFSLLNALLRHQIDLFVGFTENYNLLDGLRQRVLFRDRLSIVARSGHPLFSENNLTLNSLGGYPWVFLPSGPFNLKYEDMLESAGACLEKGSVVCDSMEMLKALIMRSDHLGIMQVHTMKFEAEAGLLRDLPITIPEFNRNIAVFLREGSELTVAERDLVTEIQTAGSAFA